MVNEMKVKLGLSKRKHLPCLLYAGHSFPLWAYRRVHAIEKLGLELDNYGFSILADELKLFNKYYLPPFSLEGLTVLDLGACCGETAWFFLNHGAAKVVCVEIMKSRVDLMELNKKKLGLNIDIIPEAFNVEQLKIPHDFIKCDIEGAEVLLLPYVSSLKPAVVEAHGEEIKNKFEKAGFHVTYQINPITYLMSNIGDKT
jgi:hypothetical protein